MLRANSSADRSTIRSSRRCVGALLLGVSLTPFLSGCRPQDPQPPQLSYAHLVAPASEVSTVTIPFTIAIDGAQTAIAGSKYMRTTPKSNWSDLDCRSSHDLDVAAGVLCSAYLVVGKIISGKKQYRFNLAPDRSSLVVRSAAGVSNMAAFSVETRVGYQVEVRDRYAVHSCGNPRADRNPATRKNDYLHFRLHEDVTIRPTASYNLQANFRHRIASDAPCRIKIVPPVDSDRTGQLRVSRTEPSSKVKTTLPNDLWPHLQSCEQPLKRRGTRRRNRLPSTLRPEYIYCYIRSVLRCCRSQRWAKVTIYRSSAHFRSM